MTRNRGGELLYLRTVLREIASVPRGLFHPTTHTMLPSWKNGGRASDFEYSRQNGASARLADLWAEKPALFVWLRHCG